MERQGGDLDEFEVEDFELAGPEALTTSLVAWVERFRSEDPAAAGNAAFRTWDRLVESVVPVIKAKAGDRAWSNAAVKAADALDSILVRCFPPENDSQVVGSVLGEDDFEAVRSMATTLFAVSDLIKVRCSGLKLLNSLLLAKRLPSSSLVASAAKSWNPEELANRLVASIGRASSSPTLVKEINCLLGTLCLHCHHGGKSSGIGSTVMGVLLDQLEREVGTRTQKVELAVVEGCLRGMDGCLKVLEPGPEQKRQIYDLLVKICVKPEESGTRRRLAQRSALEVLANHVDRRLGDHLLEPGDAKHWYQVLREWTFSPNRDDRKAGWRAMQAFLKALGKALASDRGRSRAGTSSIFHHFVGVFAGILRSNTSPLGELGLAVQGYSALAPACRVYLPSSGDNGVALMLHELVKRTEQLFLGKHGAGDEDEDLLVQLPTYAKAVGDLALELGLEEANHNGSADDHPAEVWVPLASSAEKIFLELLKKFPLLPNKQFQSVAIKALCKFCSACSLFHSVPMWTEALQSLVLQGLIETCSHPALVLTEYIDDGIVVDGDGRSSWAAATESISLGLGIVSAQSFISLWVPALAGRPATFNCFMRACLDILERLDFSLVPVSSEEHAPSEGPARRFQQQDATLDSTLRDGSIAEQPPEGAPAPMKKDPEGASVVPAKAKDFTVLVNLTEVVKVCWRSVTPLEWFRPWCGRICRTLMKMLSSFPHASGLYRILALILAIGDKLDHFGADARDRRLCVRFLLEEVLDDGESEAGRDTNNSDLVRAKLELIMALPLTFVGDLLTSSSKKRKGNVAIIAANFRRAFDLGKVFPDLAEKGVDAIGRWHEELSLATEPLIELVLCSMKTFLNESKDDRFSSDEDGPAVLDGGTNGPSMTSSTGGAPSSSGAASSSLARKSGRARLKEGPPGSSVSPHERIRKKILLFFGQIPSKMHPLILPSDRELSEAAVAWSPGNVETEEPLLQYLVPFPDSRPAIHLEDGLLPRTVFLALNAKERRTRVAAAEFLHVCFRYLIGKSATVISAADTASRSSLAASLYARLLPAVLRLSSEDEDVVVQSLFKPLVHETINWFSITQGPESRVLLESIMDGICGSSSELGDYFDQGSHRRSCLRFLESFLAGAMSRGSLNSTSEEGQSEASSVPAGLSTVKAIVKRLYAVWLHPDPVRRASGLLAFDCIKVLAGDPVLMDHFAVEMTVRLFHCVALNDSDSIELAFEEAPQTSLKEAVKGAHKAMAFMIRVLSGAPGRTPRGRQPGKLVRRVPYELSSAGLPNSSEGLVAWLLKDGWVLKLGRGARRTSMEFIRALTIKEELREIFEKVWPEEQDVANYLTMADPGPAGGPHSGQSTEEKYRGLMHRVSSLIRAAECSEWFIRSGLLMACGGSSICNTPDLRVIVDQVARFLEQVHLTYVSWRQPFQDDNLTMEQSLAIAILGPAVQGGHSSDVLTPRQSARLSKAVASTIMTLLDFSATVLSSFDIKDQPSSTLPSLCKHLPAIVFICALDPDGMGFDPRDLAMALDLKSTLRKVVSEIRGKPLLFADLEGVPEALMVKTIVAELKGPHRSSKGGEKSCPGSPTVWLAMYFQGLSWLLDEAGGVSFLHAQLKLDWKMLQSLRMAVLRGQANSVWASFDACIEGLAPNVLDACLSYSAIFKDTAPEEVLVETIEALLDLRAAGAKGDVQRQQAYYSLEPVVFRHLCRQDENFGAIFKAVEASPTSFVSVMTRFCRYLLRHLGSTGNSTNRSFASLASTSVREGAAAGNFVRFGIGKVSLALLRPPVTTGGLAPSGSIPPAESSMENAVWVQFLQNLFALNSQLPSNCRIGHEGGSSSEWQQVQDLLFQLLTSRTVSLRLKCKILDLLGPFVRTAEDRSPKDDVYLKLLALSDQHFPLSSAECSGGGAVLDYRMAVEALCRLLEVSGSVDVLRLMSEVIFREANHYHAPQFQEALRNLFSGDGRTSGCWRPSLQTKAKLLDASYQAVRGSDFYPVDMRERLLDGVLLNMLHCAHVTGDVVPFFSRHIADVLENLNNGGEEAKGFFQPSRTIPPDALLETLHQRTVSLKLVACLYTRSPRDVVHSLGSPVTAEAYRYLTGKGTIVKAETPDSGKELSKHLVVSLKKMRSEEIAAVFLSGGGGDALKKRQEAFRRFQCEGYNAMIAVMSRLQDQEKFFNAYLFREEPASQEFIWSKIVDPSADLKFTLDKVPAAVSSASDDSGPSKEALARAWYRRWMTIGREDRSPGGHRTASSAASGGGRRHYLSDSSLSQDVTSAFDFHDSHSSLAGPHHQVPAEEARPSGEDQWAGTEGGVGEEDSAEETVVDALDCHECMAPLVGLLRFLRARGIIAGSSGHTVVQPGSWLSSLKSQLLLRRNSRSNRNVQLFILRLVLNCQEVFQEHSSALTGLLVQVVADDEDDTLWGKEGVNYFSVELLLMLISPAWSGRPSPASPSDCAAVSRLFSRLALEAAPDRFLRGQRRLFQGLMDLADGMVSKWRECLLVEGVVDYGALLEGLTSPEPERSGTFCQVAGLLARHGVPPFFVPNSSPDQDRDWATFSRSVARGLEAKNLKSHVYRPVAEACGRIFRYYGDQDVKDRTEHQDQGEGLLELALAKLKETRAAALGAGGGLSSAAYRRWIDVLHTCCLQYPDLLARLAKGGSLDFMSSLSSSWAALKGESLFQILEVMASDAAVGLWRDQVHSGASSWPQQLGQIGIKGFLCASRSRRVQMAALCVLKTLMPVLLEAAVPEKTLGGQAALDLIRCVEAQFVQHPVGECRRRMYSVAMVAYDCAGDTAGDCGGDPTATCKAKSLSLLMLGLGDPDPGISSEISAFINDPKRLAQQQQLKDVPGRVGGNCSSALKRFMDMFEAVLGQGGDHDGSTARRVAEASFRHLLPELVLSLSEKSVDFERKIYSQPLLQRCASTFRVQRIDTDWQAQHGHLSTVAPLWVETLSLLPSQTQGQTRTQAVLTNMGSYISQTSQRVTPFGGTWSTFSTQYSGTLSTPSSSGPKSAATARRTSDDVSSYQRNRWHFRKLSQEPSSSSPSDAKEAAERARVHFSKVHAWQQRLRKMAERNRRGRSFGQVALVQDYRVGELPDVEISNADILRPMKNLCHKDALFCKELTVGISLGLLKEAKGQTGTARTRSCPESPADDDLVSQLVGFVNDSSKFAGLGNRYLAASVMDILVHAFSSKSERLVFEHQKKRVSPGSVVLASKAHGLEPQGVLILEGVAKSLGISGPQARRGPEAVVSEDRPPAPKKAKVAAAGRLDCLRSLFDSAGELYTNLGDMDSARGLLISRDVELEEDVARNAVNKAIREALSSETIDRWSNARDVYAKLLGGAFFSSGGPDLQEASSSAHVREGYYRCLEHLSEWQTIAKCVDQEMQERIGAELPPVLLSRLMRSNLHLIVEEPAENNELFRLIGDLRKTTGRIRIEEAHGLELALMYICKDRLNDAKRWHASTCSRILDSGGWAFRRASPREGRSLLWKLQRLSQMDKFFSAVGQTAQARLPGCEGAASHGSSSLNSWAPETSKVMTSDDLQHLDDLLSDRLLYLKKLAASSHPAGERPNGGALAEAKAWTYLHLNRLGLGQHNLPYSLKMLKLAKRAMLEVSAASDFSKGDLERSYLAAHVRTRVLRCSGEQGSDLLLEDRINALYRVLMETEESKDHQEDNASLMLEVCTVLSRLVGELGPQVRDRHQLLKVFSAKDKMVHFANRFLDPERTQGGDLFLTGVRSSIELHCYHLLTSADVDPPEPSRHRHFRIAEICHDLWRNLGCQSTAVFKSLVKHHLLAMAAGDEGSGRKARQLFPDLVTILEEALSDSVVQDNDDDYKVNTILPVFVENQARVPAAAFLPWRNQVLAIALNCSSPLVIKAMRPLLYRLAESFPVSMGLALIPLEQDPAVQDDQRQGGRALLSRELFESLKQKAFINSVTLKVLDAVGRVRVPDVLASDYVGQMLQCSSVEAMASVAKNLRRDLLGPHSSSFDEVSAVDKVFIKSPSGKSLASILARLEGLAGEVDSSVIQAIRSDLKHLLDGMSRSPVAPPGLLKDYSPFLDSFNLIKYPESVALFDQFDSEDHLGGGKAVVNMASFYPNVASFDSIRRPVKISILGDDGRKYDYIVKRGEDLRQDQRIQQFFSLCNDVFRTGSRGGSASLGSETAGSLASRLRPLVTYPVVPLSGQCGLIGYVPNTSPYKSLATPSAIKASRADARVYEALRSAGCLIGSDKDFAKAVGTCGLAGGRTRGRVFLEVVEDLLDGSQALRCSIWRLSANPEGFFHLRANFLKSHASSSVASWLISLGDRHAGNFLVSRQTGDLVAIDFGHAFGSGLSLPIPELVPFRMTPAIQAVLPAMLSYEGVPRESMSVALKALREQKSVLMATLSIFIREPTLDWKAKSKDRSFVSGKGPLAGDENALTREYAATKVGVVEQKLNGHHPGAILLKECDQTNNRWHTSLGSKVKELVKGPEGCVRSRMWHGDSSKVLEATQQVDCLLEMATDPEILSAAYRGWSPWI